VTVVPVNDAPDGVNDTDAITEGGTISKVVGSGVLADDTDVDGNSLTVTGFVSGAGAISSNNAGQTVSGTYGDLKIYANGSYTYTANNASAITAGASATDTFTYRVSDGNLTDTATLVFTVHDETSTTRPIVTAKSGDAADGYISKAEADSTPSTVSSLTTVNGTSYTVVFTGSSGTITKNITGDGSAKNIQLTDTEIATLGDGAVSVTTTATDGDGNQSSTTGSNNFTIDRVAPEVTSIQRANSDGSASNLVKPATTQVATLTKNVGSADDDGDGITNVNEGLADFEFTTTQATKQVGDGTSQTFTVDDGTVEVSIVNQNNSVNGGGTVDARVGVIADDPTVPLWPNATNVHGKYNPNTDNMLVLNLGSSNVASDDAAAGTGTSRFRVDFANSPNQGLRFSLTDIDLKENVAVWVYDKDGNLIEDISSYMVHTGSHVATSVTNNASDGVSGYFEANRSDGSQGTSEFYADSYVAVYIPVTVSKIEFAQYDKIHTDNSNTGGVSAVIHQVWTGDDTDGDGILDQVDLDSDNDWKPDVQEDSGKAQVRVNDMYFKVTLSEAVASLDTGDLAVKLDATELATSGYTVSKIGTAATSAEWLVTVTDSSIATSNAVLSVELKTAADSTDAAGNKVVNVTTNTPADETYDFTPPLAIDLDGDGQVSYQSLDQSAARYDFDNDGIAEHTAWVAANDGLIGYDANGDGLIAGREELVLSDYLVGAKTDLEGLAYFDSNVDGVFSADDLHWADFLVWQDVNGDGISSSDELMSLDALGVGSISLESDNNQKTFADGDVIEYGKFAVNYLDGGVSVGGDAAFLFDDNVVTI
jgi:VCBS repeat-containing protein